MTLLKKYSWLFGWYQMQHHGMLDMQIYMRKRVLYFQDCGLTLRKMTTLLQFLANCLGNILLMQGLLSTLSNLICLPSAITRCSQTKIRRYGVTFPYLFRMSKEAGEIIQKFYLKLRDHNTSADCTPITARQLESLVRLAQARARVDLREDITVQDAMVSQNMKCLEPYV